MGGSKCPERKCYTTDREDQQKWSIESYKKKRALLLCNQTNFNKGEQMSQNRGSKCPKMGGSKCPESKCYTTILRRRLEKVFWQVECNSCQCTGNTLNACTRTLTYLTYLIYLTYLKWKLCNFGFAVSTNAGPQQCQDRKGKRREAGEEWKEDCNSCWCVKNGVRGCTYKRCPGQLSSGGVHHSGKNSI